MGSDKIPIVAIQQPGCLGIYSDGGVVDAMKKYTSPKHSYIPDPTTNKKGEKKMYIGMLRSILIKLF